MKQLKFNPDKDMELLKEYGFIERSFYYLYKENVDNFYTITIEIDNIERTARIGNDNFDNYYIGIIPTILYDLIKANLLIVEDKDEN